MKVLNINSETEENLISIFEFDTYAWSIFKYPQVLCIYFVKLVGCKWLFKNVKKQQTTLTTFTAIFNSFLPTQAIFTVPKEPDPSCLPRVKLWNPKINRYFKIHAICDYI